MNEPATLQGGPALLLRLLLLLVVVVVLLPRVFCACKTTDE